MKKLIILLSFILPMFVSSQTTIPITAKNNESEFFSDSILLKIIDSEKIDLSKYHFTSLKKIVDTTPYIQAKKINFSIVRKVIYFNEDKVFYTNVLVKQFVYENKRKLNRKFITAYRTLEKSNGFYHIELYSIE